ncbi:trans-sulfuration enzyme family protein [Nitratireductor kimnyeongensis]|uniref:Trans-sulfuration enzyme family protein n=1 Tax=Nitratireductor kimnyeongensis TaxID=430679 RepID=A0ABW0T899_9HYPH|nr:PLP-dependent transferase [Nitratireductor kimnyeongensis]QZZ34364.1 PLP-dependent transferase [Nitratireductor kimnyeongensis]
MSDLTDCVVTPRVATDGFDPLGVGVHRGSTIVFSDAAAYASRGERGDKGYSYGLYGTPTTRTLEEKLSRLEQAARTFLVPSGQAANAIAAMALVEAGQHLLLADTVYPPMRDFALNDLSRLGVSVEFFDPTDLDDLKSKIRPETRLVWCESPGSTTMEVMDLPAAAEIAHEGGALLGVDNTWATPLNLKPLTLGADLVTEALTKYVSGHSDVLLGSISVRDPELASPIKAAIGRMGIGASPDDASLVLRGLETLGVRLRHSEAVARRFCERLTKHPMIDKTLFPALQSFSGHALFQRDFLGASGVFTLTFTEELAPHVWPALDRLRLFAIGASWGGTRSLVAPMPVRGNRSVTQWSGADITLRISIGLEDEAELWEDMERFLAALEEFSTAANAAQ